MEDADEVRTERGGGERGVFKLVKPIVFAAELPSGFRYGHREARCFWIRTVHDMWVIVAVGSVSGWFLGGRNRREPMCGAQAAGSMRIRPH